MYLNLNFNKPVSPILPLSIVLLKIKNHTVHQFVSLVQYFWRSSGGVMQIIIMSQHRHSPKIPTIQQGWPREISSVGNPWQTWTGYFFVKCARVWYYAEVARFTLLHHQNFMRMQELSTCVSPDGTHYRVWTSWWTVWIEIILYFFAFPF